MFVQTVDALQRMGFQRVEGEEGTVQRFENAEGVWVAVQDHPGVMAEDVLKHLKRRGVDMHAFFDALGEADQG